MKRSLALEILAHLVTCGSRFVVSSFFVPYGQSLGRALREAEEEAERCPHDFSRHSKGAISVTLNRMKKKKLVSISGPKKKAIWRITIKGRSHFRKMDDLKGEGGLPPEDGKTRIVMFDIPENRKVERNWLRRELLSCDYTPMQKSVFMGIRPLPIKLLQEVKTRGLYSNIHVVGLENN